MVLNKISVVLNRHLDQYSENNVKFGKKCQVLLLIMNKVIDSKSNCRIGTHNVAF